MLDSELGSLLSNALGLIVAREGKYDGVGSGCAFSIPAPHTSTELFFTRSQTWKGEASNSAKPMGTMEREGRKDGDGHPRRQSVTDEEIVRAENEERGYLVKKGKEWCFSKRRTAD